MSTPVDSMHRAWSVEQDILDVIDTVCKKHHLCYSLAFGTLLGAVRHGGFIPWDDDIDIMMPRADYEKLLVVWKDSAPREYVLQNKQTNFDFTQNFTKICKDHTTFLQEKEEINKTYHKGVFVDIFPVDRVAPGKISKIIQYAACAVNLLYSRGFTSGSGGLIGIVERIMIRFPVKVQHVLKKLSEKIKQRWNDNEELDCFVPDDIHDARVYHTADLFADMTQIGFSGRKYSCTSNWETYLKTQYGDYMEFPPKEERIWKHTPLLIDFDYNYEELDHPSI